jgi:hypothetical protein
MLARTFAPACLLLFIGSPAVAQTPIATADIVVQSVRLTDNGDNDGFADPNETVNLFLTLRNVSDVARTGLVVTIASTDASVDCISTPVLAFGSLAPGETRESSTPLTFRVANVMRSDPSADLTATFDVLLSGDGFGAALRPQQVVLDLDLNVAGGLLPGTFSEGFEGAGFGSFTSMTLDLGMGSNALSDGLRCQYRDPDFVGSGSYQRQNCYVGLPSGNAFDWHVHGMSSPDAGRAYLGNNSLHWGMHIGGASLDTSRMGQLDAVRTSTPVNLGWNGVTSELSFKHQAGLTSCFFHSGCFTGPYPVEQSIDAGVVHVQLASSSGFAVGNWRKIAPYENVYDGQGTTGFVSCTFDPYDDGNDEDDYFFPSDPQRRFGPSSTCYPEFVFSRMGAVHFNAAFDPADIGAASDGPGLQGSFGPGTWVESKFSLARWRGRRIRLRFLVTSLESNPFVSQQDALLWNPTPADDGWYIDDIRVTNTLFTAATVSVDTTDRSGLPACAAGCGSVTAFLDATPSNPEPDAPVTLDASGSSPDACPGGLHYRFWSDRNLNGVYGDGPDVLHRDWSSNPILVDTPIDTNTLYGVEVRCASEPACAASASEEVLVQCPSPTPVPFPFTVRFENATRLRWGGAYLGVDVVRGNLAALRAGAGQFDGTVDTCVADGLWERTLDDAATPDAGEGFYYLLRRVGPTFLCHFHSWGTGAVREVPGAGGSRDTDLAQDLDGCP